ncbi:AraC-type DNA-binding protein [Paenibacillus sp. UNCCL117]|uniref:helix-turn-helix domain-containing protein n=1 Tax=unclassified Paenibacillus TaxID=185978 RepID=UPI00088CA78F|nr:MULTISPECIES: AraC family transcriptional regulator [unclassified Paenibacillus]SDC63662.1 AraC-type DNA-binding protein [Paenibacillus sp. cl123]SFW22346.1 AraC-type DNA-binding protein [Paenibacillus sp. UNCCL117]
MKFAKITNTSLFLALCLSFGGIIALLMSFNYLSYSFFRENLRENIIKSNSLNLNTTVANYEKNLVQLKSYLMTYLFKNDTQAVAGTRDRPIDYELFRKVQMELQVTLNNSILYIDNIFYFFKNKQLLIDKNGTRDVETMFSKLYVSPTYNASFWNQEMTRARGFHIYPGETFQEQTSFQHSSHGVLLPVLVKSQFDDQFGLVALLDGTAMYKSFHQPVENGWFYMFDQDGKQLFASSDRSTGSDPAFASLTGQGHMERGDVIYVYQRAQDSGYLYVDIIPVAHISEQIKKLNLVFILFLAAALLLSLIIALFIAKRFQNPLTGLMQAIEQNGQFLLSKQSRIKEFKFLSDKINDLFQVHRSIHRDLDAKNSLLQHYAYISRLKMISANLSDIEMAIDNDRPYRLLLLHLALKDQEQTELNIEPHRAYSLIQELIRLNMTSARPDSLTFQTEQDHILTILFEHPNEPIDTGELLESLRTVLQPEVLYFNFTIGLSPLQLHASQFAATYELAVELVKQRKLNEDIQVFTELAPVPLPMVPTLAQEQELATHLHAGNAAICITLVNKQIEQLHKANAPASHIQAFGKQMIDKTIKAVYAMNLSIPGYEQVRAPYEELKKCYTAERCQLFFERFLTAFGEAVRLKKEAAEADYVITFVKDYVEANYGQDISLEHLAQKLNLTSSYLSAYFKEKTGTNLSEYTNALRMNKAMEMLRNTDLKIQDIAALVGCFTIAPFNRAFKRYTGQTPTEFRRSQQALN